MITKSHFMHQAHALVLNINTTDYTYLCNGYKTLGNGKNFRCQPCNFDMHEFCIDCPRQLASFLHPQHSLNLLIKNSELATSFTTCDVCGDSVNGLFYCCQYCNFNVHPVCTQFPQYLRHAVHPHRLVFQKPYIDAACFVCGDVCVSWRYRCGECDGFDVHVDCVTKPCVTTSTLMPPPRASNSTYGGSTSRRLPPYAGIYTYGGVICSPSPIPNPNSNSFNKYNPIYAYHSNMIYCAGWPPNTNGEIPYGSNMQNVHSHHVPAQNVQSNSSQGHGFAKIGSKIFSIMSTLTLGVASNVIFGVLTA